MELSLAHSSSKSMDLKNSSFVCQVQNSSFYEMCEVCFHCQKIHAAYSTVKIDIFKRLNHSLLFPRLGCLVTSHLKYQQKANTYDIFAVHIFYRNKRRFWKHQSQIPLLWQIPFSFSFNLTCCYPARFLRMLALHVRPLLGTAGVWFLYDIVEYGLKQNDAAIFDESILVLQFYG